MGIGAQTNIITDPSFFFMPGNIYNTLMNAPSEDVPWWAAILFIVAMFAAVLLYIRSQ